MSSLSDGLWWKERVSSTLTWWRLFGVPMFQKTMKIENFALPRRVLDVNDLGGGHMKPWKQIGMLLQKFSEPISKIGVVSILKESNCIGTLVGGWSPPLNCSAWTRSFFAWVRCGSSMSWQYRYKRYKKGNVDELDRRSLEIWNLSLLLLPSRYKMLKSSSGLDHKTARPARSMGILSSKKRSNSLFPNNPVLLVGNTYCCKEIRNRLSSGLQCGWFNFGRNCLINASSCARSWMSSEMIRIGVTKKEKKFFFACQIRSAGSKNASVPFSSCAYFLIRDCSRNNGLWIVEPMYHHIGSSWVIGILA